MFHWLEKRPFFFGVGIFVVIAFAGLVMIIPHFVEQARPVVGTKPYTTLELTGRQLYISNNCVACHSQLIRPFKNETDRYGSYSLSGEYGYDRPFLWGSKRTGPDLMRVGNYRTTDWHENHMMDPAAVVPGSIMPAYPWLFTNTADIDTGWAEAETVRVVFNVPYNKDIPLMDGTVVQVPLASTVEGGRAEALFEAQVIAAEMKNQDVKDAVAKGNIPEIVALIAYLNALK
jgi:cytochrome c oxidase cbb3-type subunit 2